MFIQPGASGSVWVTPVGVEPESLYQGPSRAAAYVI